MVELSSLVTATAMTPLGAVSLHAHGSIGVTIEVNRIEIPDLPDGMAVEGVLLIQVGIVTPITRGSPLVLYVAFNQEGDAETGEWLESMAFQTDKGVLQVAARDLEWLLATGIVAKYAEYKSHGFKQTILEATVGTTLHISVAWRLADGAETVDDISTWIAADLALPA